MFLISGTLGNSSISVMPVIKKHVLWLSSNQHKTPSWYTIFQCWPVCGPFILCPVLVDLFWIYYNKSPDVCLGCPLIMFYDLDLICVVVTETKQKRRKFICNTLLVTTQHQLPTIMHQTIIKFLIIKWKTKHTIPRCRKK